MRLSPRTSTRVGVVTAVAAAGALVAAAALPAAAASPAPSSTTALSGSTPAWATTANATGDTAGSAKLQVSVRLTPRDAAGAEAFATAVSSPGSQLGKYLTPAQYKARFAATDATVDKVTSWLSGAGLTVTATSSTNASISVSGTAAQLQKAFGTTLKQYKHDGTSLRAPASELTVPTSVAGAIQSVSGLTQSVARKASAPPPAAFVVPPICSAYYGQKLPSASPVTAGAPKAYGKTQPLAVCGYTPSQLRKAYGTDALVKKGLDGRGVTVAIVDAYNAPTIKADADQYSKNRGEPTFTGGQFTQIDQQPKSYGYDDTVNGDQCGENGWYGEETLDVEAVHGMAPGAKILYVGGRSCQDADLLDSVQTIIDGNLASIISNSYGDLGEDLPADEITAEHTAYVQAAAQGIGVYFSSGDDGDEVVLDGARSVDYPASDTFVTAVGGTSIAIDSKGRRQFELGWETSSSTLTNGAWTPTPPGTFNSGAGGGVSKVFKQPSYQKGVVPAAISQYFGGTPGRAVPDVAAIADPNTGFLVGETQTFAVSKPGARYGEYRIGGTSVASPITAGIVALANQLKGHATGFINYRAYRLSGTQAFYDPSSSDRTTAVVRVNFVNSEDATDGYTVLLRSFNQKQTINLRKGYDDVTGVGTPNGLAFLVGLAI